MEGGGRYAATPETLALPFQTAVNICMWYKRRGTAAATPVRCWHCENSLQLIRFSSCCRVLVIYWFGQKGNLFVTNTLLFIRRHKCDNDHKPPASSGVSFDSSFHGRWKERASTALSLLQAKNFCFLGGRGSIFSRKAPGRSTGFHFLLKRASFSKAVTCLPCSPKFLGLFIQILQNKLCRQLIPFFMLLFILIKDICVCVRAHGVAAATVPDRMKDEDEVG